MVVIVLGIALVVLSVGAHVLSDFASITALIPAIFGVVIAILGVVGRQQPDRQRLAPTESAYWDHLEFREMMLKASSTTSAGA